MKATFFERVGSYLIDTVIVTFIFSLICLGVGNNTSTTKKLMEELDDKLLEEKITVEEYLEEYQGLMYDYQKENVLQSGISVALTIAYYVVFQYMNKGQSIGKKLLKLRVVDKNTNKPISILKGLLRSLLILSILSGTLSIILLYIVSEKVYFPIYSVLLVIEGIFVLTTIILILYKKDKRGLHDIITNTVVIKESR